MSSERVAEGVGSDALGEFGLFDRFIQRGLHFFFAQVIPPYLPGFRDQRQGLL